MTLDIFHLSKAVQDKVFPEILQPLPGAENIPNRTKTNHH